MIRACAGSYVEVTVTCRIHRVHHLAGTPVVRPPVVWSHGTCYPLARDCMVLGRGDVSLGAAYYPGAAIFGLKGTGVWRDRWWLGLGARGWRWRATSVDAARR